MGRRPASHRDNFDCLRLIGALLVLYSHQYALAGRPEPMLLLGETLGELGVLIFFSISGYLVQLSWDRDPHPGRFLLRRFLRIWPGLAVAVLVCFAIVGPAFAPVYAGVYFADPHYRGVLRNLWFVTGDPAVFAHHAYPGVNGSIWTIPKEVACYVALAVAGSCGLLKDWRVPLIGVAAVAILYLTVGGGEAGLPALRASKLFYPVYFAAFFGAGVVQAKCADRLARLGGWLPLAAMAASVLAALSGETIVALWCAVPVLSVWFGRAAWPVCRSAGRYGDFSYGLYLYAWPAQQIVVEVLGADASIVRLLAGALSLTGAAAILSWLLVERVALRLKPAGSVGPATAVPAGAVHAKLTARR